MFLPMKVTHSEINYSSWEKLSAEIEDMRTPLTAVSERLLFGLSEQFATQGSYGGERWTALSPQYAEWKINHGGGDKILVGLSRAGSIGERPQSYTVGGKMRKELLEPQDVKMTTKTMTYIAPSNIASFHQKGTEHMPERPLIPVPMVMKLGKETDEIFRAWINDVLMRVGL